MNYLNFFELFCVYVWDRKGGQVFWKWSFELLCGCWELSPYLLEKQPALLTPEPALQALLGEL